MTFFYDLNKKLDSIREKPETTHGQLNERDMSRAAKGYEKYGKQGMEALAKAGREGKALDPVRKKYNKYDEGATGAAVGGGLGALAAGPLGGAAGAALGHYAEKGMDTEKTAKESMGDMAKKVGGMAKKVGGKVLDKLGHGSDADMIRDLQRKMGVPQTGKKPKTTDEGWKAGAAGAGIGSMVGGIPGAAIGGAIGGAMEEDEASMTPKQKSFAKLAPPKDKITFADKIAGAKKEVDEMLGDVAAEAMKGALSGGQKKLDKNNNGNAVLRKGAKQKTTEEDDDNPFTSWKKPRADRPKVGSIERGHKHDIEHTATGRKVTRRVDDQGHSVGADDAADAEPQKRGRGRPSGTGSKMGAKGPSGKSKLMTKEGGGMKQTFAILDDTLIDQIAAMNGAEVDPDAGSVETYDENTARQLIAFAQKNPQRLKRTQSINTAGMRPMAQRAGGTATGPEYGLKEEGSDLKAAMALLKKAGYKVSKSDSKPESNNDSAPKKKSSSSKPDFADVDGDGDKKEPMKKAAKEKGSSEDKPKKVKEEGGTGTPTASSGFGFGKGIYDSLNRDLEAMIAESMSINMSDSTEGGKSLTITASDEDALKLGMLLKNAGLGGGGEEGSYMGGKTFCPTCGSGDCGCGDIEKEIDENAPDWPTEEEGTEDAMMYSGGLNGPKSTGQTTVPVIASQENRQHTYEAELQRMRDIAGIKEAKKPDFLDVDKDGNKKEPFKKAVDDKEEKKVEESIFALTNSWKAYKG